MLHFIGTGGAFSAELGNNSAYMELGTELFIFDCGVDVFSKLQAGNLFEGKTRVNFFITHLHCDHAGGLGVMIAYLKYMVFHGDASRICVYFPSKSMEELLRLQGLDEQWYTLYMNRWDELAVDGMEKTLEYSFEEASHTEELDYEGNNNCFSIEMSMADEFAIFYSGDTNFFAEKLKNIHNYDAIYHEVTGYEEATRHLSYSKLLEATKDFTKEDRKKIVLMHLDDGFDVERAKKDGFSIAEKEKKIP